VVDHWHVSTPARAGRHPSFWYRFEGSGLPVHHFEVWRRDQTDPVFVCGRCMRRGTGQYDSEPPPVFVYYLTAIIRKLLEQQNEHLDSKFCYRQIFRVSMSVVRMKTAFAMRITQHRKSTTARNAEMQDFYNASVQVSASKCIRYN